MTIVLITLAVVCAMCGLALLALVAHSACRQAFEPELLVFDEPLTEGIDFAENEDATEARA